MKVDSFSVMKMVLETNSIISYPIINDHIYCVLAPWSIKSLRKCMPIREALETKAVVINPESSIASFNNSNRATHAIAPPAKPKPAGRMGIKWYTNSYAGTAIKG